MARRIANALRRVFEAPYREPEVHFDHGAHGPAV